jgi:RNA polymerase sigma factor (sigma-70 family)
VNADPSVGQWAASESNTSSGRDFPRDKSGAMSKEHFEGLIAPIMPDLLRYFARRVTPVDDAYDCLSETLIVLWRSSRKLPADANDTRAWSFGVARKVLANHVRGQSRRAALTARIGEMAVGGDHPNEDAPVREALEKLPGRDQELVRLIVWDGFGVAEAGALLGLKPATARTRYARAKSQLKRHLG